VFRRIFSLTAAAAMAIALVSLAATPAAGQAPKPASKPYTPPRTPDGHPDLQGTYDLATITPLERLAGAPAVLTPQQAVALEQYEIQRKAKDNDPIQGGDRAAPPKGGDKAPAKSYLEVLEKLGGGPVGGYNQFWLDSGTKYTVVDGQIRSSIVVDPPDGKVPPVSAAARQRQTAALALPTSDAAESANPGLEPGGSYDDPERRPLSERCLLGFGSTSGPPALPDYFYNNLHQIVQTPNSIMILTEMVHDARIVRMNAQHLPKNIRKWLGDSVGHWEGDTLVVDTTNFNDKTRFHGATDNMHVVERFTRVDAKTLLYRFTVDDPNTWDKPWTGEYTWPVTDQPIYEYACHETNYAMGDVLRGARAREAETAAAKAK
jgi:hypothetical protein